MGKAKGKGAGSKQAKKVRRTPAAEAGGGDEAAAVHFLAPLRPRPKWLIGLGIVFALWIVFLLVLYFRSVYPHRHEHGKPATGSAAALDPAAPVARHPHEPERASPREA